MKREVPKDLLCPISHQIMVDPVLTCDGHTYDRASIEPWLKEHNTGPSTGSQLGDTNLTPNYTVRKLVDPYLSPEQIKGRYLAYQQRSGEDKATAPKSDLYVDEKLLQTKYPGAYQKLIKVHGYTPAALVYPFSANELNCFLIHFELFERLVTETGVSLSDFGNLEPEVRKELLEEFDSLARLILDAKIPLHEIPSILSDSTKKPGYALFVEAEDICKLVAAGIDWKHFYMLEECIKEEMLLRTKTLCPALVQMSVKEFLNLPPKKMYAFVKSIYGLNLLVTKHNITWGVVFLLSEKDYAVIHRHHDAMCGVLANLPVTLKFLLSQPDEALVFMGKEISSIISLHEKKAISIDSMLSHKAEDREFLASNSANILMLMSSCKITVYDILALNDDDRDFLIKYTATAYNMYMLRDCNKNPADRAVNLPPEDADRVRWTINTLKKCLQPDGTFVGLAGIKTRWKAAPAPTSLSGTRSSNVSERDSGPLYKNSISTKYCRHWTQRDRNLHAFAVVSAFLSPVTALVAGTSIATLSGTSATSAGVFFGAMIGLTQTIPLGGQIALAAVFTALALVGLGYAGYELQQYVSRHRYRIFPCLRPARPPSNATEEQRPLLP